MLYIVVNSVSEQFIRKLLFSIQFLTDILFHRQQQFDKMHGKYGNVTLEIIKGKRTEKHLVGL